MAVQRGISPLPGLLGGEAAIEAKMRDADLETLSAYSPSRMNDSYIALLFLPGSVIHRVSQASYPGSRCSGRVTSVASSW